MRLLLCNEYRYLACAIAGLAIGVGASVLAAETNRPGYATGTTLMVLREYPAVRLPGGVIALNLKAEDWTAVTNAFRSAVTNVTLIVPIPSL